MQEILLDLQAPILDIVFPKGYDLSVDVFVYDELGNVVDLSGVTALMQARISIGSTVVLPGFDLTSDPGGGLTITNKLDPTRNVMAWCINIFVHRDVTSAIPWYRAKYAMRVNDSLGNPKPICRGDLTPFLEVLR